MLPSHPAVRRLVTATVLASGGVEAGAVALAVVTYHRTHSTAWVSAVLVASLGLAALFGPLGGVVADRRPRRQLMITVAVLEGAIYLAMLAASHTWELVALAAVAAAVYSPYEAALAGVMPNLVSDEELPRATAAMAAGSQTAILAAPLLAGLLAGVAGGGPAFVAVAFCFLAAAFFVGTVEGRFEGEHHERSTVGNEMRAGLRALWGERVIAATTASVTVAVAFAGATLVAQVALAEDVFHRGGFGYGLMTSGVGAGLILGSAVAGIISERRPPLQLFVLGMTGIGVCLGLVSIAPLFIVALGLLILAGIGNGIMNTTEMLLYQRLIPNHLLGRVRGAALSLIRATYATSIVLGGVLISPLGTRGVYAVAGTATLLGTVPAMFVWLTRRAREPAGPPAPSG
jgi:MFS family permease